MEIEQRKKKKKKKKEKGKRKKEKGKSERTNLTSIEVIWMMLLMQEDEFLRKFNRESGEVISLICFPILQMIFFFPPLFFFSSNFQMYLQDQKGNSMTW